MDSNVYYLPGWIYRANEIEPYAQGKGLDIGCYRWPWPRSIPVEPDDRTADYIKNTLGKSVYKTKGDDLTMIERDRFNYVFSSHCLEHIKDWKHALDEWVRVIKVGGYLILYLPHPRRESYRKGVHPSHVNEFVFDMYYTHLKDRLDMVYGQSIPDKWDSQLYIGKKI